MSTKRVTRTELAASLGLTPADFDRLVADGILPARGRRGWDLADCQQRLALAATADRFGSTPAWLQFLDDFERLAREASAALAKALAELTPETARSAADAGAAYFSAWSFCIATLADRLPPQMGPAVHALNIDAFSAGLAAVGQVLDDRSAVRFLN